MADIDVLPQRGVHPLALVGANGVAIGGSATVADLAARRMQSICQVDPTGIASSDGISTVAQLASRGIRSFAAVDELGVSTDDAVSTADVIRRRGIRPMVAVDANGISQTGSATIPILAQRGLSYFCPVDETGTAGSLIPVPPNTIRARAGIFPYNGETMTPVTAYAMPMGMGSFAFGGQSAALTPPVASYAGPGDSSVQPGATAWYGLRAYTAAKATALAPCIILVDTAGNNDVTINLTAAGDINVAAITSWIAVNSGLRSVQKVKQVFDQVGTRHLTTTGVSGALAEMPTLIMSGLGSHPVMGFASGQSLNTQGISGAALGLSNPSSVYAVAKATAANSTAVVAGAAGPLAVILWSGGGTVALFAGGFSANMAAADGTFWTMQGVINDTSSIGQINTTQATGLTPGNSVMSGEPTLSNQSFPSAMQWLEAGFWSGNKSSTFNAVNTNAKAYWGY